jgi:hypothetical protein
MTGLSQARFQCRPNVDKLFDCNFSAGNGAAAEEADPTLFELDDAVAGGVNREVAAYLGAGAGTLGHAGLTDDDLSDLNLLAAEQLNA